MKLPGYGCSWVIYEVLKLYHWTLNAKKIMQNGFHNRAHRHSDDMEGVWFTDKLMGPLEGVHKDMKVIVIEVPLKDAEKYEETNEGAGYRAFSIPSDIVNDFKISNPIVYRDRGIYKLNE